MPPGPTNAMQIYVRQVSGGRPVALTSDPTDNFRWPRWSPDGSQIAYQSNDGIYVVPALGGSPRLVTKVEPPPHVRWPRVGTPLAGFDWSPDGSRIAWALGLQQRRGHGEDLVQWRHPQPPRPRRARFPRRGHPTAAASRVAVGNTVFIFGTGYFANAGASAIWVVPSTVRLRPESPRTAR